MPARRSIWTRRGGNAYWKAPLQRRAALFGPDTTGYRLINGESDGWPGLVLDRYASALVLKLYTAAWLPHLQMVLALLTERFSGSLPGFKVVLRLSRNIGSAAAEQGLKDGQVLTGDDQTVRCCLKSTA